MVVSIHTSGGEKPLSLSTAWHVNVASRRLGVFWNNWQIFVCHPISLPFYLAIKEISIMHGKYEVYELTSKLYTSTKSYLFSTSLPLFLIKIEDCLTLQPIWTNQNWYCLYSNHHEITWLNLTQQSYLGYLT